MSHGSVASTPARNHRGAAQLRGTMGTICAFVVCGSMALPMLAGCGDPTPPSVEPTQPEAQGGLSRPVSGAQGLPVPRTAGPSPDGPVAGNAGPRYDLILLNGRVVHQDLDQLDPQQGKGYLPLQAFVYVKGRPRGSSPVASVKPVCLPAQCEYIPPRKAGFAERYVISISDDSVVQLSASEDTVVISARQLAQPQPTTVDVTLTIPGQPPIVKRIVYGTTPG